MKELVEALTGIKGEHVDIYTQHKLFGNQYIQMKFMPETEKGIGFWYKKQVIYMDYNEVIKYEIKKSGIVINGKNMDMHICIQ